MRPVSFTLASSTFDFGENHAATRRSGLAGAGYALGLSVIAWMGLLLPFLLLG